MKINEARKLIKVKIRYIKDTWVLGYNGKEKTFYGDDNGFKKILMRIKASDTQTDPKSVRNVKYMDMVQGIKKGKDNCIWIYDNVWNKLPMFMKESKNEKINTLSRTNYKENNDKRRFKMRQSFRERRRDNQVEEKPVVFDIEDIKGFDKDGSLVIERDNRTYNVDSRDGDKIIVDPGRVSVNREEEYEDKYSRTRPTTKPGRGTRDNYDRQPPRQRRNPKYRK